MDMIPLDEPRYKINMAAAAPNTTSVIIATATRDSHELG
jgi:hypothetical protein